jgi:hypothetical protein
MADIAPQESSPSPKKFQLGGIVFLGILSTLSSALTSRQLIEWITTAILAVSWAIFATYGARRQRNLPNAGWGAAVKASLVVLLLATCGLVASHFFRSHKRQFHESSLSLR